MKEYNVKLYDNFSQPHNIKVACDKEYDIDNVIALPTFKYLNLSNLKSYNVFNLNNLSYSSLKSQLDKFDTSRPTFLYIDDVTKYIQDYECIVSFCIDYRIVVIANAGSTLEEMGRCDKQFGMTPVGLLEDYGVLDLEPIILGGANLDKDDYEKLSYYNATLCLNITNDMLNGNGIAQIVTAKKYNVNMIFNCKDIYKEISLAYDFPAKWFQGTPIGNLSLKLQATNLFLIYADKKLNGQDPEFINAGGVASPMPRQFTFTLKLGL